MRSLQLSGIGLPVSGALPFLASRCMDMDMFEDVRDLTSLAADSVLFSDAAVAK